MRPATAQFAEAVVRGSRAQLEITSWRAGRRLATLPVVKGSWSVSDSEDQVPGALAFQVPNTPRWRPTQPTDPLGAAGQRYHVRAGVALGKSTQWINLGWFLAKNPTPNGDVLDCSAVGLLELANRARLLAPLTIASGTSRAAAVKRLLQGILPVISSVADETMSTWTCEQDRLQGVWDLMDAWPARLDVDDNGIVRVRQPWSASGGAVVKDLVDGERGTLASVSLVAESDDAVVHNAYRVSTIPANDALPVSESWSLDSGPWRWGGPYGFVPAFYESAMLNGKTRAQLKAVARQLTLRSQAVAQSWTVKAAPDPRVQKGDVVHVRDRRGGLDFVGRVIAVTHTTSRLECTVSWMRDAS